MDKLPTDRAAGNRPPPKWTRTLRALLTRPHLDRFEAERDPQIRDHTLPSTVADLQRGHRGKRLRIERRIIKRPGFAGEHAMVAQYWLAEDQREIARQLLEAANVAPDATP